MRGLDLVSSAGVHFAIMRVRPRLAPGFLAAGLILSSLLAVPTAGAVAADARLCGTKDPCLSRDVGEAGAAHCRMLLADALRFAAAQAGGSPGGEAGRIMTSPEPSIDAATRIPPALAFVMSAILPGTGQLAERRNRAFAYLGVEALAWVGHLSWSDAANKKEGEYEAFARRNWDLETWKSRASGAVDSCQSALPPGSNYAEELAKIEEMLASGDLDALYDDLDSDEDYRSGWVDYTCSLPTKRSPLRSAFADLQDDADTFQSRSSYAKTALFLNRVVSAIDAYMTARGAQLRLDKDTKVELQMKGSLQEPRAVLRIRRTLR